MERPSMVHRVVVDHAGHTYHADYFVEAGVIHANLGGHIVLAPITDATPADTVRSLLSGQLARRSRKLSAVAEWTSAALARTTSAKRT
jgi:hypothetical protein